MIISSVAALAALSLQAGSPWTWTLYDNEADVVLAQEVPDTDRLGATLECGRGSGRVALTLYGQAASGMAVLTAANASATAQAEAEPGGGTRLTTPTDHPVFRAFVGGTELKIAVAGATLGLVVPAEHLPKLRRLSELCG